MLFKLIVRKTEDVEIPDLDPEFMSILKKYKTSLYILDFFEEYADLSGLYTSMEVEVLSLKDKSQQILMETELSSLSWDRINSVSYNGETDYVPYFQSDDIDGYHAIESWVPEMRSRFPGVRIITTTE